ncbi:transglycosylase SLT domain-containing protein [Sphingobium sp. CR28]|uniref:transglycosylase SLT domain-containing protein n=1 Tax=Sphingobium sp. CR28 TaxID=3400272 RepID=UPI003FF0E741
MRFVSSLILAVAQLIGGTIAAAPVAAQSLAASTAAIYASASSDTARYRPILSALSGQRWSEAKAGITALDETDSMRPWLLGELYTAKNSPRVELFDLMDLLAKAPWLPKADQIGRLATKRGAQILPQGAQVRQLMWTGGAPQRAILRPVKGDAMADSLRTTLLEKIKADDPAGGEALLSGAEANLGNEGRTELRQRLAWSYYITGRTADARRMAALATQDGVGGYVAPAWWVAGLAAWREKDWAEAGRAFAMTASRADDADLRSGGYFWAARAAMAERKPEKINALLQAAGRYGETFYGMLARETLGIGPDPALRREPLTTADLSEVGSRPNARNAIILSALGQSAQADEVLRREAELAGTTHYAALVHLASALSLPTTQLWLAQRSPSGAAAKAYGRYPSPDWTPSNGWQVEKALVYAHTLQESRFRANAVSMAGARGVMQVRPGTAAELAAANGLAYSPDQLDDPAMNLALGQLYLKKLAGMSATGGLLPKVIAAYNAGPTPIDRWNVAVRDEGDPLLFIESVPYYETRAYLNAVLRNYWIYQIDAQGQSPALSAMAQGMWTRFPDGSKDVAVRMKKPTQLASGSD